VSLAYEAVTMTRSNVRPQPVRYALMREISLFTRPSKARSGSPNRRDLIEDGHACNLRTVAQNMRRQSLRAKAARKFKATTHSNHNLLEQDFTASAINQKWVGDISVLQKAA